MNKKAMSVSVLLSMIITICGTSVWGQQAKPKYGGTLVIALGADPPSFNTATTTHLGAYICAPHLYNGLVRFTYPNFEPEADLAESWRISPDAKIFTFRLRKDVRFHDGKPFTSADVKFTIEKAVSKFHSRGRTTFADLDKIETPDEHTVVIHFKTPYAPLLKSLIVTECPIIPKHIYDPDIAKVDILKNPKNLEPIGTGPFKFKEYAKGSRVVLERNENYYKKGVPYLIRLVFTIAPDPAGRVLAFEKGEADYLPYTMFPESEGKRFEKKPEYVVKYDYPRIIGSIWTLAFNINRPITGNPLVRKAIAYSIDRNLLNDVANYGYGKAANSFILKGDPYYNPNLPKYEKNLGLANKFLDQAGYPKGLDGTRFRLEAVYDGSRFLAVKQAELIREMLREVGISVRLSGIETTAAFDKMWIRREFDICLPPYGVGPDPSVTERMFGSWNIGTTHYSNAPGYNNSEVDALFAKAKETANEEARKKIFFKIQEIVLEDLPYLYTLEYGKLEGWRDEFVGILEGYSPPHAYLDNVWWKKGSNP